MSKAKIWGAVVGAVVVLGLLLAVGWTARKAVMRFFPIHHTGKLARIGTFHKGGIGRSEQGTRQINQFALLFEDGFQCEGTDTSFAAIKAGDTIEIRAYHDVHGWPVLEPEWWECDEAQLVRLVE